MEEFIETIKFYLPLGIIGAWRWGIWLVKKIISLGYKHIDNDFTAPVSVIVPVYNEDPAIFRKALESWKKNNPAEIIAVIDDTDTRCINEFKSFMQDAPNAKIIITSTPGKRPALADGIKASNSEILALVDSDTIWSSDVMKKAISPFADEKVGGTTVRQNVLNPKTLSQKIFDMQMDLRFFDEMMPLSTAARALSCLSGRTSFYRRKAILPFVDDMVNETFMGKQCIGGDDKRFTYLIEAEGYETRYQHEARVYTHGMTKMKNLFMQRIRWSRNTWRADLRAIGDGWVWKRPALGLFLVFDRFFAPFTLLVSLCFFILSIIYQLWVPAVILLVWWLFSRTVRLLPHLAYKPKDTVLVPTYILTTFALAIIKIYALLTLNRQDWITRQSAERAVKGGSYILGLAKIWVVIVLGVLAYGVVLYKDYALNTLQFETTAWLMPLAAMAAVLVVLMIALTLEFSTRERRA